MANVNANINVNIQTQQAAAQLRKLSADISRFNQQTFAANSAAAQQQRALNQALIDGVRTSGQFRTSIVPMTSAVENFSTAIEKGKLSLGQYTRYAASQLPGMRRVFTREFDMINRVAENRVKKLNTQFIALGESANGMRTALAMTPTALDQFAARSAIALQRQQIFNRLLRDGSTQLLNWGKNTQWAGRQLMVGFTIPLGLLGAQAAKVFRELEAEAINFKKVYGDMFTTDVEVEKNLAAIKELSMEMTKYGQTAQQTMQLANTAAQSGARGAELMAATRQATRLAILGQMEQNQAIETTISLQTAFSLSNEQLAESINFLNSVENQTILSLQDVSEAIPRVASVIKGFGGDVQDLSVLLVAMKEGGVSAAEGANALKNSMARVIAPTKRALETSAKYGIALQDIVARNEGKVVPLFQELAVALEAVGGQQRQEILSDIFGKFQYARIGTLLSNIAKEGSQAAKAIELTGVASRDLAATAERELSAVEDAVGTKFTAALEKAKVALAPVGEEFLKALTPVLDVVGKILGKFDELPGGLKTAIVAATAIIGGIAPIVLMVTGLVANGIANIAKFIDFLRKQVGILRGNGEQFKLYAGAELEAAAAAASLEGKTSSLTKTMLLQRPAIETLITLYQRLASSAAAAAAAMPTTMGGIGLGRLPGGLPKGGLPTLPQARNMGGPIFMADGKRVPGSGNTDKVPAMLTPGEYVVNKQATQESLPLLEAINSGKIIGRNKGGVIPQSQYLNRGAMVLSRAQQLKKIKEVDVLSRSVEDRSLASIFGLRFNDIKADNPSSFVKGMFQRWEKMPTRISPKENTAMLMKGRKPRYAQLTQEEYLADMIMSGNKFANTVDAFKPITIGAMPGRKGDVRVFDGHTRIHAQTVKGLIEKTLGKNTSSMSREELIASIKTIRQKALNDELSDSAILKSVSNERILAKNANKFETEKLFAGPGKETPMQSMRNVRGRTLISGVHNKEIDAIVTAAKNANFYGVKKNPQSLMESMGFVPLGNGAYYRYEPQTVMRNQSSYVKNQSRRILDSLVDQKAILPVRRNMGGIIPGAQYLRFGGLARLGMPRPITNPNQQRAVESQLTNWLDMQMRKTNVRELGKLLGRRQKDTELYRGMKMRPSDSGYENRFPKETQDALYRFAKTGNPEELSGLIGKPVAIAPRSFSTSEKVARTFAGDPVNVGNVKKDAAPLILKLKNEEGVFGFKPTERIGDAKQSKRFVKEKRFYSRGSQNEKEIVPVGDPRTGARVDAVVGRWGFDGKNVFIDTGAKLSRRELSRATKEFDTFTASRFTPTADIIKANKDLQKLEVAFQRAKRNQGRTSSKELGDLGAQLLSQSNVRFNAGTRSDKRLADSIARRTEKMLTETSIMFNRAKAAGLNRGGIAPEMAPTISAPLVKEWAQRKAGMLTNTVARQSSVMKANRGRIVPGTGNTDTVPAMLTPGEFVVNKEATRQNLPLIQAINDGKPVSYLSKGTQSKTSYKAPPQIRRQTESMTWTTEKAELVAAKRAAKAWGATATQIDNAVLKSAAHIVSDKGPIKRWVGRNLMPDLMAVNQYMNRVPKVAESILNNSKDLGRITERLKKEGLSEARVRKEIANLQKGIHPVTEKAAKVMREVAREDEKASKKVRDDAKKAGKKVAQNAKNRFGASVGGTYLAAMTRGALDARTRVSGGGPYGMRYVTPPEGYVTYRAGAKAPTPPRAAPTATVPTGRQASAAQSLARQIKINNPRLTSSQALNLARLQLGRQQKQAIAGLQGMGGGGGRTPTFLGMPGMPEQPRQSMMGRINSGVGKFGMGAGMGLSMAAMLPMMKQDEQGKFMGMDAGTAMMGLMGGGMLLSIAPMLGAAAAPVIGVAAVAAGVGLALKAWRNNVDETSKKTADLGANIGGTANALNTMSQLFGEQTPAQRRAQAQLQFSASEQETAFGKFQNYLGSELGQKFIKDLENATSAQRFEKLSDYLKNAIAGGILTGEDAKLFAKTIASALGDPVLGQSVLSSIKGQLTGARGMLDIAQERDVAIQEDPVLSRIISQTKTQEIAYADAAKMAGASLQALQDFGNAAALANEQYVSGTISFDQYRAILDETTERQNVYADALEKSIRNTTDFGGTMMAMSDQLSMMGLSEEQRELILSSGTIDTNRANAIAREQIAAQYGGLTYSRGSDMYTTGEGGILSGGTYRAEFRNLASEMISRAEERQPELGAAAAQAVVQNLMSVPQAKEIADLVSLDQDLYNVFSRAGGGGAGMLAAGFARDTQVRQIEGLDEEGMRLYREIGVNIVAEGYDLAAFQSFVEGLPQEKRINIVANFTGMSDRAQQAIIATGSMGEQVQQRLLSSSIYQSRMPIAREQRSTAMGGYAGEVLAQENITAQQAEQDIENINNAINSVINSVGEGIAADIILATNTISNGDEQDPGAWIRELGKIERQVLNIKNNFPPEIASNINIDFTSSENIADWSKMSNVFSQNLLTLQQLNPNVDIVASMRFLTLGSDDQELTPKQVADNVIQLNTAWSNLEKSTKKEVRAKALLTIGTAMMFGQQGEDGTTMSAESAGAFVDEKLKELAEATGGKVYNADPNIVMESIQIMFDMSQQRAQAAALEQSAAELGAIPGLEATASLAKEQAAALLADAERREQAAIQAVRSSGKKGASTGGDGGGGGGTKSPVQGFTENILNQFKMWVDASAKMGDLNNARTKFVDMVLKGDSIFNRLNKVKGIDPMRLQEILGMGPEGAQEFLDKYSKGGKLTKAGKGILDAAAAAGINETIGMAAIQATQTRQQTRAANILSGRGAGSGLIQQIAGDPRKSAELVRLQKEYNQAVKSGNEKEIEKADKALNKYIRSQGRAIQAEKDREEATKSAAQKAIDSNNDIIEANNKAIEEGDYYFQKEESRIRKSYRERIKSAEDQIDSINKQIDAVNKLIDEQEKLNRSDQNRIRGLERQKEMLNRQLEELDRANELDQRRIETLSREDEMRGRVEEALSRELELMSRAEEDIRDSYQKRIDALDEVAKVNDYILNQQRQQLDLSRAISEGDIYAATAAAQEMRASSAGFAVEQVRQGLETGMENQVEGLRTSEGLTREQAEERIRAIQDQSYQTSLQIRDIEDAIYNRNLQMIPIKDQIRNYDLQIRDIQDNIYNRESEILRIQTEQLEPLQTSLSTQQGILDNLNDQVDAEIEAITYNGMNAMQWADNKELIMDQNRSLEKTNEILQEEDERLAGISKKWENIAKQIRQANRIAKEKITSIDVKAAADIAQIKSNTDLSDDEINEAVRKRTAQRLIDLEAAEKERQEKADKLLESGSSLGAFAGGLMKYAMGGMINPSRFTSNEAPPIQRRSRGGSVFGSGSRDSIAAMLTPGEFVIRKAMVDKYGIPMMEALNQGSFSMPRYSMPENMGGTPVVSTSNMTSISAPVYNTYDMKFSINGANQSADEIANKVMFKMKQLQNQQIRGNRGY